MCGQNTALRAHSGSDLLASSVLITVVLVILEASVCRNGATSVVMIVSPIQRHLRRCEMTGSSVRWTLLLLLLLLLRVIISLVISIWMTIRILNLMGVVVVLILIVLIWLVVWLMSEIIIIFCLLILVRRRRTLIIIILVISWMIG